MGVRFLRVEYEAVYAEKADITFIMKHYVDLDGHKKSSEVSGFYYGEPSEELTEEYKNSGIKAVFED